MTNMIQDPRRCLRSVLARALLILPMGLALTAAGHDAARAQSMAPAPSCPAALDSLMTDWRSIGFAEPGKPGQMIVSGRHGYQTTAGNFNFMRGEISVGARECEAGHDTAALQHINTVRAALEHTHAI